MSHHKSFLIIILLLTIIGCKDKTTNPDEIFSVSGKLIYEGKPLADAEVSLDKRADLTTQSNSEGNFSIKNVPKGNYTLDVEKTYSDGSYISKSSDLSVTNDVVIESLLLPKAVLLLTPTEVGATTIHLAWTSTDANDFREYKLYRHITSGLDENTGTLVNVSVAISDTEFTETGLNPLTTYYYRLFVMNDYGKLGGSNIVSAQTSNLDLIKNGSFENLNKSTGYPENWQSYNNINSPYYFIDSSIVEDGKYSIRIENAPGVNIYYQTLSSQTLVSNTQYKLSYWIKHDILNNGGDEYAVFINNKEFTWSIQANKISGPKSSSDWDLHEYEFTVPDVSSSSYLIGFYFYITGGSKAWLDNVSLVKVL